MKKLVRILFFGSTLDSVSVVQKLHGFTGPNIEAQVVAVVTQPDKPVGRHALLTQTPVKVWATKQKITVLSFPSNPKSPWRFKDEAEVVNALSSCKANLVISSCFGQKIPFSVIRDSTYGGLNVHPSMLPRFRGADPVPWAIVSGDKEIGISIVGLSEKFDEGNIIAQQKIPLDPVIMADQLRTTLFTMGATLLTQSLDRYIMNPTKLKVNNTHESCYARKLTREDGFVPWEFFHLVISNTEIVTSTTPSLIRERTDGFQQALFDMWRALTPWPGIWTQVAIEGVKKRLKIIACHLEQHDGKLNFILDTVQLEGKKPVTYKQFEVGYFPLDTSLNRSLVLKVEGEHIWPKNP